MIYVKLVDRNKLSVQHMTVLYIDVQLLKENSYIAESVKLLLPQGLFTVEAGSDVYVRPPNSDKTLNYHVIATNEPLEAGDE